MTTTIIQERARRLVQQEIHLCISSLVSTLAQSGLAEVPSHEYGPDIRDLAEQAAELSYPIPDYEEAAREAGWKTADLTPDMLVNDREVNADTGQAATFDVPDGCEVWREVCEAYFIEPYDREVFEHWAISDWLADKLEAKGERVDRDFSGLIVWARTTTGQAIYCDGVIEDIAREMMAGSQA